jgi:hypothetical protein
LEVESALFDGLQVTKSEQLPLSEKEMELVRQIAKRDGVTEDEAATQLVQKEIARRVRKRTGKGPAKIYAMRRR